MAGRRWLRKSRAIADSGSFDFAFKVGDCILEYIVVEYAVSLNSNGEEMVVAAGTDKQSYTQPSDPGCVLYDIHHAVVSTSGGLLGKSREEYDMHKVPLENEDGVFTVTVQNNSGSAPNVAVTIVYRNSN